MKTMKLLPLLFLLALPAVVQAQFTFTTNNGAITITGYTGFGSTVVIPDAINGYPVTSIGSGAFVYRSDLWNVTIPNSVTNIGSAAFYDCTSLTSVTIGNGVISIGGHAFDSCTNLTSMEIPNSVTSIGWYAFYNCTSLTSVTIGTNVTSIGSDAFDSCTSLTSVTIPNSVTSIGSDAFSSSGLTSVTIGNGVTIIGNWAFSSCTSLTSVTIPNSVTNIGYAAFSGCFGLTAINVAAQNLFYSSTNGVLFDKSQTTLIQYPGGLAGSYIIANSVTSIGDGAFYHCISLTNVTIPNSVIYIGEGAFYDCTSLTNVTIPDSVTSIGDWAFEHCSGLTSVTIGNSVTIIGSDAFYYCYRLTNVTIPDSVTSIGDWAFEQCSGLKTVCFQGDAPGAGTDSSVFSGDPATGYYLSGKTGWGSWFDGLPMVLWNPQAQTGGTMFGVRTNRFGFNITGSSNLVIVVEACTNLANADWLPVSTNTLNTFIGTNGTSYFSDSQWTNYPGRFYRLRSP
jgi:hypothetical protein